MGTDESRGIQSRRIEERTKISEDEVSVERPPLLLGNDLSQEDSDAWMTERYDIKLKDRTDKVYFQERAEIHFQKFRKRVLRDSRLRSIERNSERPF